jgi:DNA modification methylase
MKINTIIQGDCLEALSKLEDNSIDTVITDPPYGLSFMGKKWDYEVPKIEVWQECLRVLKPGGTALIFAGSRTQHRMAVNVEDAGFELFDTIFWVYGQGFPKSHNIEKALIKKCSCGNMEAYDKQNTKHKVRPLQEADISQTINSKDKQGKVLQSELSEQSTHKTMQGKEPKESSVRKEERILEGGDNLEKTKGELQGSDISEMSEEISKDGKKRRIHNATQASNGSISKQTTNKNGSGTSRRPQSEQQPDREPCAFCQQHRPQEIREWSGWGTALKPSYEPIICARKKVDKTYAQNALKHGVSGLNIDGGRIKVEKEDRHAGKRTKTFAKKDEAISGGEGSPDYIPSEQGRFPANILLDEEAAKMLDEQSGELKAGTAGKRNAKNGEVMKTGLGAYEKEWGGYGGKGGASRFFYVAKASKSERNAGCEDFEPVRKADRNKEDGIGGDVPNNRTNTKKQNFHPTVKPLKLMEYLCTLTKTPTGGIVLDPFAGSGTTGLACINTGRDYILIEREEEYIPIIKARLKIKQQTLL